MATTTALLSIEQYLKTEYRPDCDFVDGEIEKRNLGEKDHNRIQLFVGAWFLTHERFMLIQKAYLSGGSRVLNAAVTARLKPCP